MTEEQLVKGLLEAVDAVSKDYESARLWARDMCFQYFWSQVSIVALLQWVNHVYDGFLDEQECPTIPLEWYKS